MRTIVVGTIQTSVGIQQVNVWFRFPATGARKAYYAKANGAYQPQAPGDYAVADTAEIGQFQDGSFVEQAGFKDVIDPTSTLTTIQTRLVNIYNAAKTAWQAGDDATLSRWASSYDGTTWTMKSS